MGKLRTLVYIIKVLVQPGLGNNGKNFGRNLNHQTFKYINVKLPNLDLKQGISYLEKEGERGGRGSGQGGGRQKEREIDRDRERESKT
jgi:hypothetical protein